MNMDKEEKKSNKIDAKTLIDVFDTLKESLESLKEVLEVPLEEKFYVTYPAVAGLQSVTYNSTNPKIIINFFTGTVLLPDGTKLQYPNTSATSEPLKNYGDRIDKKIKYVRSIEVRSWRSCSDTEALCHQVVIPSL